MRKLLIEKAVTHFLFMYQAHKHHMGSFAAAELVSLSVVGHVYKINDVCCFFSFLNTHLPLLSSLLIFPLLPVSPSLFRFHPPRSSLSSPPVLHPSRVPFGYALGGTDPRGEHRPVSLLHHSVAVIQEWYWNMTSTSLKLTVRSLLYAL